MQSIVCCIEETLQERYKCVATPTWYRLIKYVLRFPKRDMDGTNLGFHKWCVFSRWGIQIEKVFVANRCTLCVCVCKNQIEYICKSTLKIDIYKVPGFSLFFHLTKLLIFAVIFSQCLEESFFYFLERGGKKKVLSRKTRNHPIRSSLLENSLNTHYSLRISTKQHHQKVAARENFDVFSSLITFSRQHRNNTSFLT